MFLPLFKIIFKLALRGMGVLNYADWKVTGEDYFIKRFLSRNPPKLIFDVGANEGRYTEVIQSLYGCEAYCFEPNPKVFTTLQGKFKNNSKVRLINAGLSDRQIETVLYDYKDNPVTTHASLYQDVITKIHQSETDSYPVTLTTLDKVVEENNIQHIDLLKIDTEGHDFNVLKGAEKTLENGIIDMIQFEFSEFNIYSRVFFNDYKVYLMDYSFFRLLPRGLLPMDKLTVTERELYGYQNIIGIRRDRL
jgi:FkbM family methyltransferase